MILLRCSALFARVQHRGPHVPCMRFDVATQLHPCPILDDDHPLVPSPTVRVPRQLPTSCQRNVAATLRPAGPPHINASCMCADPQVMGYRYTGEGEGCSLWCERCPVCRQRRGRDLLPRLMHLGCSMSRSLSGVLWSAPWV